MHFIKVALYDTLENVNAILPYSGSLNKDRITLLFGCSRPYRYVRILLEKALQHSSNTNVRIYGIDFECDMQTTSALQTTQALQPGSTTASESPKAHSSRFPFVHSDEEDASGGAGAGDSVSSCLQGSASRASKSNRFKSLVFVWVCSKPFHNEARIS